MFHGQAARVFALPPGVAFPEAFADGLVKRLSGAAPETIARVEIFANAQRSAALIAAALANELGPACLLPRIRVVTDLAAHPQVPPLPLPVPDLRRQLRLADLVHGYLKARPAAGPVAARFELARRLAGLIDELDDAGIAANAFDRLDVGQHAAHWADARSFLAIIADAWPAIRAETELGRLDPQARQRAALAALSQAWTVAPPSHPVIVAGSTGSRPLTAGLMQRVAELPQGAVVLPGFDAQLPSDAWAVIGPEHPQAAIGQLLAALGVEAEAVGRWAETAAPLTSRAELVSLALQPAPVTDAWRMAAPILAPQLAGASAGLTLVEAASAREEALTIALAMRETLEHAGRTAALVTPDRQLARQVTVALDRWGILPDDTAGRPLGVTPPGVFLRLVGALANGLRPIPLLAALKHPLAGGTGVTRRQHVFCTGLLESALRAAPRPSVDAAQLPTLLAARGSEGHSMADASTPTGEASAAWAAWVATLLAPLAAPDAQEAGGSPGRNMSDWARLLHTAAAALCGGPTADRVRLWDRDDGRAAAQLLERLVATAGCGGLLTAREFAQLLDQELAATNVPPADPARPVERRLKILGNREARLETADLVILGGLAEGVWPALPPADPWLSRPMRAALGLAAPERRIGLAAHDFQTALGASRVMITRPRRRDGAPVLPARWLVRLIKLMEGCGSDGVHAVAQMRRRGAYWTTLARSLDRPAQPVPPAERPAPSPPVPARPRSLSVTRIEMLIRDPYAIYAAYVLRLHRLEPPDRPPDARLRGTVLHRVLQRYVSEMPDPRSDRVGAEARLIGLANDEIDRLIPWPAERRLWRGRIARAAAWFVAGECARRDLGTVALLEEEGATWLDLPAGRFRLKARADRIDRLDTGALAILDYKTGKPPSTKQIKHYQRQLPLTAVIAEAGGFRALGSAPVERLVWLGLDGSGPGGSATQILAGSQDDAFDAKAERARIVALLSAYDDAATPYKARLMPAFLMDRGDYDHLARLGEWEGGDAEEDG
ncbi:MAG: double-strand break repair protein AddB [Pseudomonadota bacterium]